MDSAPTLSPPDTVCANLRMIWRGLLAALGAWRVEPVRALVMYNRISATFGQIERMLQRFRAGRLLQMPPRVVVQGRKTCRKPGIRLPRRFGWLVQAGGHQAACAGLQLQTALSAPEMVELLAVSPQARRVLRPLCRALAVELPWVIDQPRAVSQPRKRMKRPKPEPFRIPLPRGVLAAAKRQGFGKMC